MVVVGVGVGVVVGVGVAVVVGVVVVVVVAVGVAVVVVVGVGVVVAMKSAIKAKLIKALKSGDYLLNLKDKDAPLCEILPDGRHRFSPAGVLCDIAPKEACDWKQGVRCMAAFNAHEEPWEELPPDAVEKWSEYDCFGPPINGHRTLSATIKAVEEL